MSKYYLASQFGFYDDRFHGLIPEGAVRISDALYSAVMTNRPSNKVISTDANGMPCLVDPVPPTLEQLEGAIRAKRNALLAQTDWTQSIDIPVETQVKWRPYRQALRDVPEQNGFPNDVQWPAMPQ